MLLFRHPVELRKKTLNKKRLFGYSGNKLPSQRRTTFYACKRPQLRFLQVNNVQETTEIKAFNVCFICLIS